jgi:hypothetical protein
MGLTTIRIVRTLNGGLHPANRAGLPVPRMRRSDTSLDSSEGPDVGGADGDDRAEAGLADDALDQERYSIVWDGSPVQGGPSILSGLVAFSCPKNCAGGPHYRFHEEAGK